VPPLVTPLWSTEYGCHVRVTTAGNPEENESKALRIHPELIHSWQSVRPSEVEFENSFLLYIV